MNNHNENKRITDHELHENIHELFEAAKKESLSHEEKQEVALMLKNLMAKTSSVKSQFSILSPFSYLSVFKSRQFAVIALAIVLIFGGLGGTAYAAKYSLPGGLLYGVKVNVNEKLEAYFASTDEEKARVALKHAVTRLDEIEKLAESGKIENIKSDEVSARIAIQTKEVEDSISKLKDEGDIELAVTLSSDFESSLNDHKKHLENIVKASDGNSKEFLAKTRENIRDKILASAKERLVMESTLSDSNEIVKNKKQASSELAASQKKVGQITASINASVATEMDQDDLKERIKTTVKTVADGEEKISVGAYKNALALFDDAKNNADKIKEELGRHNSSSKKRVSTVNTAISVTSTTSATSGIATATTSLNLQATTTLQASASTSPQQGPTINQNTENNSPIVPSLPIVPSTPTVPISGGLIH